MNSDRIRDMTALLSKNLHYVTDTIQFSHHRDTFDELLSVWQEKSSGYRVIAKSLLYKLLYHYLIETERHIYHPDTYYKLIPAQEFLDHSYFEEPSISELARLCNLGETHFRRLFSQIQKNCLTG